ncbi:hypothetical protein Pfo_031024 [Paulownia fortunei]|nr:hypothetical protein Pfo_031024 [Paulownia fortunei]
MEVSSTRKFNSICVFCGSNLGKNGEFIGAANNLGRTLAQRKIHLVYGGGSLGLMGSVAISAYVGGVKVLGVVPKSLTVQNITGMTIGDELKVSHIQDRIPNMLNNADAFIILPGGFGTLEELFQIVSWAQLNIHQKPIGILNVNGFYDGLLSFVDHAAKKGFISTSARRIIISAPTLDQLIDQLLAYVPKPDPALANVDWSNRNNGRKRKLKLTLSL